MYNSGQQLEFETPPAPGIVIFRVRSPLGIYFLWDITDRYSPIFKDVLGANETFEVDAARKRLMVLSSSTDIKRPVLSRVVPTDLTGPNQGEFILIAPAAFRSALSSYAAHRASYSEIGRASCRERV